MSQKYMKECKYCKTNIEMRNDYGKWEPYNLDDTPHDCRKRGLAKTTTTATEEDQRLTVKHPEEIGKATIEKAAVVPLTTTALVKILVWGDVKDLEQEYNTFVAKIRRHGARIHGSTYQVGTKPSIAVFFEIPNAAVGEVEK